MKPRLLFVHALSPLHAGTGQSIGAIELATARDRATGFPYLPGSSIKGALRARGSTDSRAASVFGPATAQASDHAGAVLIGDANLLLLPVRSVAGTFAYATSPYLLQRFARDVEEAKDKPPALPRPAKLEVCQVAKPSWLSVAGRVVFEDLDFLAAEDSAVSELAKWLGERLFGEGKSAWREGLTKRLCVVHDDAMAFLSEHATDVVTRVALEPESKTVKQGQLWHEENLPTETVLVSLVAEMSNGKTKDGDVESLLGELCKEPLQLGGKATVGRGRCQLVLGRAP
jgi:CRISPR-associated protein Cmr4